MPVLVRRGLWRRRVKENKAIGKLLQCNKLRMFLRTFVLSQWEWDAQYIMNINMIHIAKENNYTFISNLPSDQNGPCFISNQNDVKTIKINLITRKSWKYGIHSVCNQSDFHYFFYLVFIISEADKIASLNLICGSSSQPLKKWKLRTTSNEMVSYNN